ncbi:type II secretion system protein [Bacteriovorax sp. PP10]|uniref:Type II secretion system protein n=1 Tax=Bacteriovorax antarcticus TaxID=3088717 RepID=A0ABU5VT51_9BACT|nr:type II secretion system protein [Bacteriovorax sp. PP10]MEA9355190.1 type II secretion system protein [Bacteriovorax sp. PP10]
MNSSKKSGFSLVEIMVALGLVAGLGMVVMQVMKSSSKGQVDVMNFADYSSIKDEVTFLINNSNSCKASLAGFTFNGSTIKDTPKAGVELWGANQDGDRTTKKFFGGALFGKTEIEKITFSMPDYTAGINWPAGVAQSFTAQLVIAGKKSNMGNVKAFNEIKKSINVVFDTDASGLSTIKSCSTSGSGGGVLVSGTHDLGTAIQYTETITTTAPGVLMFTGWVHMPSAPGSPNLNAGVRGTLKVNNVICSSDYSFEGETSTVIFDAAPVCILPLPAGTHTLELIGNYQVATSRSSSMSWVVVKE